MYNVISHVNEDKYFVEGHSFKLKWIKKVSLHKDKISNSLDLFVSSFISLRIFQSLA